MKPTNERRRKFPRFVALAAFAALLARLAAAADQPVDPLTLPISPGSVALLIERAKEPAVQDRWSAALKDVNSQTRAAAARVIHATGSHPRIPDLREALQKESAPDAAYEIAWALADLSPSDDALVLELARSATGDLRRALIAGFSAAAPGRGTGNVTALEGLELTKGERKRLFASPSQPEDTLPANAGSVRTAGWYPNGYLRDVLAVTGCKGEERKIAGVVGTFERSGRAKGMTLTKNDLGPPCAAATWLCDRTGLWKLVPERLVSRSRSR